MVYEDEKESYDQQIAFTEYMASFWNPEAVKKIQDMRSESETHKFKTDKEFEEEIISGSYKDNPIIDAIRKISKDKHNNKYATNRESGTSKTKLPTDLSTIQSTIRKFD